MSHIRVKTDKVKTICQTIIDDIKVTRKEMQEKEVSRILTHWFFCKILRYNKKKAQSYVNQLSLEFTPSKLYKWNLLGYAENLLNLCLLSEDGYVNLDSSDADMIKGVTP